MKRQPNGGKQLTDEQVDDLVVAEADVDSAWHAPVEVRPGRGATVRLSAELAARAALLARLHRQTSTQAWLESIIRERVVFEESALSRLGAAVSGGRRG
jgi:hypothetical protein